MKNILLLVTNGPMESLGRGHGVDVGIVELGGGLGRGGFLPLEVFLACGVTFCKAPHGNRTSQAFDFI